MLILPTLLKAAGAGLGIIGQLGSANRYEATAGLNRTVSRFNATQQRDNTISALRLDAVGTNIELGASRMNLRLALADSQARQRNAERLRLFAEARSKSGREAIRRQMRAFDEFQGRQVSAIATAGVALSGSALDVMLESAEQFRTQIQDMHEEAAFERRDTLDNAELEEFGAGQDAIAARVSFQSAKRGANLRRAANRIGRISARTTFQSALMDAELDYLQGQSEAQGERLNAVGSMLGGIGSLFT